MVNMMRQQESLDRQTAATNQQLALAQARETREAAAGQQAMEFARTEEARKKSKFNLEQSAALVSAIGTNLVNLLRDPSDASIAQAAQTFTSVGMEPQNFNPILQQIRDIPDPNARKLFALQFISQSDPARAALKFVMPELKSEKVGDASVFYDNNPSSPNFGSEVFRLTVAPEPIKMNQTVVDGVLMNTNPATGVSAEATIGDPTQGSVLPSREPTYTSTGVRSPYAVGAGTGQPLMAPRAAPPAAPPAQAVRTPSRNLGAPGVSGNTADVVYGFGRFGSPPKPLSQSTIGEVQDFQRNTLIPNTRGKIGAGPDKGTGAVGTYQLVYGTLKDYAPKVFGPNWRNQPFTAAAQEQLAKAIYEDVRSGDLSKTWAGLPSNRPGQYANVPWEQVRDKIISVETGTGMPTGAPKTVSEQARQKGFAKTLELFDYNPKTGEDSVSLLIKASTSGGLQKLGSDVVGFFGEATPGRVAIGQLASLKDNMTFEKLRGKLGAQISDADVRLVANTMGDIADPNTPSNERLAKWQKVVLPILVRGAGLTPVKRSQYTPEQMAVVRSIPGGPRGAGGTQTNPTMVMNARQYARLPKGAWYIAENGYFAQKGSERD
jgi:hypothetical protein